MSRHLRNEEQWEFFAQFDRLTRAERAVHSPRRKLARRHLLVTERNVPQGEGSHCCHPTALVDLRAASRGIAERLQPYRRGDLSRRYRQPGRTGWKPSEISLGAWDIGGAWGGVYGDGRSERLIAPILGT